MRTSVFGHLAHRFTSHPENLATEALAYISARSPIAAEALSKLFRSTGAEIPENLFFKTQATDADKSIPDFVGISKENKLVVVCEAKFWAGLTENQPVTYLNRGPNLLIFLSPSMRIPTLWPELLMRCRGAGLQPTVGAQASSEIVVARISESQFLAATSWRAVLDTLYAALSSHGDLETASDVLQLQGLCEQMDSEAFLPIRGEETSPAIANRLRQLNQLVDEITEDLVSRGIASTTGFRATPIRDGYGRYMRVGNFGIMIQVNFEYWSSIRETPVWLDIKNIPSQGGYWTYSPEAHEQLGALERESRPRLIRRSDSLLVPIHLPFGEEKTNVMRSISDQLNDVVQLLSSGK